MARATTSKLIERTRVAKATYPDALGPTLGVLVAEGNVPLAPITNMLEVSEVSLYRWFYGDADPHRIYHVRIKELTKIMRRMKRARELPIEGTHSERLLKFVKLVNDYRQL